MTFEEEAFRLYLKAGHLSYHLQCPATQVAINESLQVTLRNKTPKLGEVKTLFFFRIS
jgi:hypothetical protein